MTDLRSQNGYRVASTAKAIGARVFAVPGHSNVKVVLQADVAPLLLEMMRWWFTNVEAPVVPGCWGYAYRPIRGQTTGFSNHASATAVDINAPKHPQGKRGTVPASKRAAINAKASSLGLRWGANYVAPSLVDEMHFEINVPWGTAMTLVRKLQAPAKPATSTPSGTLRQGSTGAAVKALQVRLNRDYPAYSHLATDGVYGSATTAVVREFQKRAGLPQDGVAGAQTLARLGLA